MMVHTSVYRQKAVVADLAAARGLIDVKRAALLFDSVVILKTQEGEIDKRVQRQPLTGVTRQEIDWLTENRLISFIKDPSGELLENSDPDLRKFESYRRALLCNLLLDQADDTAKSTANFVARYAASCMAAEDDESRIIPISFAPRFRLDNLGAKIEYPYSNVDISQYNLATAAVLAKVPVPDELTPWEAIMEFREERTNRAAFLNLRKYISKLSTERLSAGELRDELELDTYNLENALKRAKIKYRNEVVETVIISVISVVENLVKFKFSESIKSIFSVTKSSERYLDAEAKIAKNSTYYIVRANDSFGVPR